MAPQAPLSMGFPRQEYWGGLPFPSPGPLPNPRSKLASSVLAGKLFITEPPGKSPLRPEAKPKTLEIAAAVDCQTEGQISPWGPFTLGFKTNLAGWSARADEGNWAQGTVMLKHWPQPAAGISCGLCGKAWANQ